MKDVCIVNQSITDEFKTLDDEHYQEEYKEHQRKMNIIDSYEEEINKVMFLFYSAYIAINLYFKHRVHRQKNTYFK